MMCISRDYVRYPLGSPIMSTSLSSSVCSSLEFSTKSSDEILRSRPKDLFNFDELFIVTAYNEYVPSESCTLPPIAVVVVAVDSFFEKSTGSVKKKTK